MESKVRATTTFIPSVKLQDEVVESKSSEQELFVCDQKGCDCTFTQRRKLINHVRLHLDERPFKCSYTGCDKSYTNSSHLNRHIKVFHEKLTKPVTCDVIGCHKELANSTSYKRHYTLHHNTEENAQRYVCDICKKSFRKKHALQQHIYTHSGEFPFSCVKCGKRFFKLHEYNKHKTTHRDYPCECGMIYPRWSLFLKHQKICKENRIICEICNKTFTVKANLQNHMKTHIDISERKIFNCLYEDCDRFYFFKNNLNYHISTYHEKNVGTRVPCQFADCKKVDFKNMVTYKQHLTRAHIAPKKKLPPKPRKDKGILKKSGEEQLLDMIEPLKSAELTSTDGAPGVGID